MNPLIADIQMPLWLALLVGGVLSALVAFFNKVRLSLRLHW